MNLSFEIPVDFSFEIPSGASYQAIVLIQGSPIYSDSSMNFYGNVKNLQNGSMDEVVTHPKIETRYGTETLTRVKKRFADKARNTLGCTIPFTGTYHINSGAEGMGTEFPEKAVDVHEIYHKLVEDFVPDLGPELGELTVRKVSDRLTGTKSAASYINHIKNKLSFYDSNHAKYIVDKVNKITDKVAKRMLNEPVKIFLPTNAQEEAALEKGQLPPYINTAAA